MIYPTCAPAISGNSQVVPLMLYAASAVNAVVSFAPFGTKQNYGSSIHVKELESLLEKIVGQTCWSMIGPAAGSWFKLDFGEKLKREVSVSNDKLREEQQQFVGEYTLWVGMTGWRLHLDKKCLCHCSDSNARGGPMDMGLRQLEGKKLLHFEFGKSAAELRLDFLEGYRLVLSDWEGVNPEDEAYILFGDGQAVTVRMDGEVSLQLSKRSRNGW